MKSSSLRLLVLCLVLLLLHPFGGCAAELLINGTFATTVAIPASSYSSEVSRIGAGGTYELAGTTGTAGWFTTEPDARFEVWTAGFMNTPAGIGNVLEFAANDHGYSVYQTVTSTVGGGTLGTLSFGYAARDSGKDAFTVSVTDVTANATVFSQAFNPTNALSNPITFTQGFALVPGHAYTLNFLDQSTNGSPLSAHIDEVSLTQIPEPSTLLCLSGGLGLLGMAAWKRRAGRRAC